MMTIQELAVKEDLLCSEVVKLYHQPHRPEHDEKLSQIFADYKRVHQAYANLSECDIEALKRGLFIQWYATTEPPYLTGIGDINQQSGEQIMHALKQLIDTKLIDDELTWMLRYYLNWSFAFELYPTFTLLAPRLPVMDEHSDSLPLNIDREAMKLRGQMGSYWNSINGFSDNN
jgi:hypothetical protein